MGIEGYTADEFQAELKKNTYLLSRHKVKADQPIAFLLGGQSGAGKSSIHKIKKREFENNIIVIDGDSFRAQHPHASELKEKYGKEDVSYTAKFTGQMVEELTANLSDLGYNLLIEGEPYGQLIFR